ncbi:hypothetical cytosolic protein [Syntrophus aciditrophicus SB]|uniref:Hypothetical cytosolic protein n=1 Tax=Syntrophus aciditrophicus (strain SB) TaxID=56780 RepID=Q2LXM5_SYNAS|nr:hypothetical cytosolic protein [Syntrophus aciditrophicus SB]
MMTWIAPSSKRITKIADSFRTRKVPSSIPAADSPCQSFRLPPGMETVLSS